MASKRKKKKKQDDAVVGTVTHGTTFEAEEPKPEKRTRAQQVADKDAELALERDQLTAALAKTHARLMRFAELTFDNLRNLTKHFAKIKRNLTKHLAKIKRIETSRVRRGEA